MDKPTLQGEMVVLRPLEARDVDAALESLTEPEGRRLAGVTRTWTREEVARRIAAGGADDCRVELAVTVAGSDDYLGEIVLERIDRAVGSASLSLVMRPAYRGRGYGTEAIELMLGMAFDGLGLHRVGLEVLAINPRVQAMYENIGFRVEGRARDGARDGDRWCDVVHLGMTEDEWRAGRLV